MVVLCKNLPANFFLVVKICSIYGILEELLSTKNLPDGHLVTIVRPGFKKQLMCADVTV